MRIRNRQKGNPEPEQKTQPEQHKQENLPATKAKGKLPKLQDLYDNVELAAKQNDLVVLLNQEPKKEWLKPHPTAKKKNEKTGEMEPVVYMPIEITEWLLTAIFIKWKVEILEYKVLINSVSMTIRLHYLDPVSGEWEWTDGAGAVPIRTNQGASATDFAQIQSSAVQTALPAAESFAIKDAAEKLGKLFGKDLNRDMPRDYNGFNDRFEDNEPLNK
jgi:hypothetical protein